MVLTSDSSSSLSNHTSSETIGSSINNVSTVERLSPNNTHDTVVRSRATNVSLESNLNSPSVSPLIHSSSSISRNHRRRLWTNLHNYHSMSMTTNFAADTSSNSTGDRRDVNRSGPQIDYHQLRSSPTNSDTAFLESDYQHTTHSPNYLLSPSSDTMYDSIMIEPVMNATLGANNMPSLFDIEHGIRNSAQSHRSSSASQAPTELLQIHESTNTHESQEISATQSSTNDDNNDTHNNNNITPSANSGGAPPEDESDFVMETVNRLRCIFSCITLPIVPIGSILSISLFYMIYAAFIVDVHQLCSHPLKLYALYSMMLFLYIPQHKNVKMYLFRYNRERDGPHAPIGVKLYDQIFYLVCLMYLSGGIQLVQSCAEDIVHDEETNNNKVISSNGSGSTSYGGDGSSSTSSSSSSTITSSDILGETIPFNSTNHESLTSTCYETCPHLYMATKLYVTMLQLFALALLLPIVLLPCIYAYIIRRVHRGAEALLLQNFLRHGTDFRHSNGDDDSNDGVTVKDIMDSLHRVRLVAAIEDNDLHNTGIRPDRHVGDEKKKKVRIISYNPNDPNTTAVIDKVIEWENVKDCCICMSDLDVCPEGDDFERGFGQDGVMPTSLMSPLLSGVEEKRPCTDESKCSTGHARNTMSENDVIVYTKCGHLFHLSCLSGWVGGSWETSSNNTVTSHQERHARRRCCPLCREDLAPSGCRGDRTNNSSHA